MSNQIRSAESNLPTIAIVGRPNVGKSTLFNRIVRRRLSIEASESGVTRDRVSAVAEHFNRSFVVIDTGGLGVYDREHPENLFDGLIRDQLLTALEGADRVILVVDATTGITPLDTEVAQVVREGQPEVLVAVNKADNSALQAAAAEFMQLGFNKLFPVSSLHKTGIDDLLDAATEGFAERAPAAAGETIHIAVVGKPNAGKSSIVNRLLGQERVIVSEIAGTTRDAIDIPITIEVGGIPRPAVLIDTAGLRQQSKMRDAVEYFSATRAQDALKRADVVLICLDASQPVTVQDKRICRMVMDAGKVCILLANKWDLAGQKIKRKELIAYYQQELAFMDFAPVITCCAISGYSFGEIVPAVVELFEQQKIQIPTSVVNQVIKDVMVRIPAPAAGSGRLKVYYGIYKGGTPPTFLLFVNRAKNCPEGYRSFLRNQFRQAFGFEGLPVVVELRDHHPEEQNRERYQRVRKAVEAKRPRQSKKQRRR